MIVTIEIDDDLYQKAIAYLDPLINKNEIFQEAMKTFVRVEAGKRMAALGGTMPNLKDVPRRRPEDND
ncbi:type II toxin-antitoxin system VapB family antitoxin [Pantoea sp. Al-1710]|uniref:Type II toxin-antitoxin system VapB family antitoxin n=1 Tax=Candidatus Pantoea communis TaxID=2608354 RepID=A0ABX0RLF0_9GAMM|nr:MULTISPECIES: type II toxin-antitoxin system VapB family antitoxin [Pantoea]NIG13001.1 type II toxin-antitoxin system VapB family antitoxin [Pantoea sp. Cy-640]NIG17298.1 type II toxin-antitoxin system VapB family antitoxin [Pantoea communis]